MPSEAPLTPEATLVPDEPPADIIRVEPLDPEIEIVYLTPAVPNESLPEQAPTRLPQPAFGNAVLLCLLFLFVTQFVPAIGVMAVALMVEVPRHGLAAASSDAAIARLQDTVLMPTLLASQVLGILFSCLLLRLFAGKDWAGQIGLRRPSLWHVLLAILGFPSLAILASGAYLLARHYIPGVRELPALLFAQVVVLVAAWWTLRLLAGKDWGRRLAEQSPLCQLTLVTAGLLVVLVVGSACYRGATFVLPAIPYDGPPLMEEMVKKFRLWPWWLAVLLIGVGPGLGEELWCRGFLGRGLVGRYGVVLGAVLTSYLFGMIHGEPHQATMAVLMGLALHYAYLMARSLWIPMLLHFLNNSLSVLASHFSPELAKIDSEPEAIPAVVYAGAGVLMLVVGWALYRSRAQLVENEPAAPGWQPAYPGVAYPPAGSLTRVNHPRPGWLVAAAVLLAFAVFATLFCLVETGLLPG